MKIMSKKTIIITAAIVCILIFASWILFTRASVKSVPMEYDGIRIMSYNLRYGSSDSDLWYERKGTLVNQILRYNPTSLGIQEGDYLWMDKTDGLPSMLVGYSYVGVGRNDGERDGEFSAIFYKESEVELLDSGNFWLSETPEQPSYGWDASDKRICTWAVFRIKETGFIYTHFNTHLDHKGKEAREMSVQLLLDKINKVDTAVVLTGDFNFLEGTKNYKTLINSDLLWDSRRVADDSMKHGTMNWYLNFNERLLPPIDFCFVCNDFTVNTYRVDNSYFYQGKPVSDHYPVIVDISYDQ